MTTAPARELFTDPDPDAVLADYRSVVNKARRDHAEGRLSFGDTITILAAARVLAARLLLADPAPLPIDAPPRLPLSC